MKPSIRPFCFFIKALVCMSLLDCTGMPTKDPETGRRTGALVFTGVSSAYYLTRDKALALALQDAARRVSFFHSVEVIIKSSESYNPQFGIVQRDDEGALVYDTDYGKYIRLLEFDPERDVYEEQGGFFVRTVYAGEGRGAGNGRRSTGAGTPSWVETPPEESGGFLYAVGEAGARLSHKDAVIASYEDAVYALVKNNFSQIYGLQQADGHTMLDTSSVLFSGVVHGFQVLETWTDPKSGAVWTLAAAREVIRKTEAP
jgi:hypothetical protein